MNEPTWFEIECVDGVAATLYIFQQLRGADLNEIRMATAALPRTVRTLRIQLSAAASDDGRALPLLKLVGNWREARGSQSRVILSRPRARRDRHAAEWRTHRDATRAAS